MGKHSKPRTPLLQRSHRPLLATALVPLVGVVAAAAAATTDDGAGPSVAAPVTSSVTAQPVTQPSSSTAAPAPHIAVTPSPVAQTQTSAPAPAAADPLPASVTAGDVPAINYRAYRAAADTIARTEPTCGIDWKLVAGIGRVESHHANNGDIAPNGELKTPIFGPTLDGSLDGNQVITDTDGGALDGDSVHDRAVGPMQFIPSTWKKYAADGNDDGVADPQNIYDAALTTARYLCDGHLDLRTVASQTTAVLRYNNSMTYVSDVLGYAREY
ncbi:lytic transglycosylase domain-containing protein [Gordonia sp. NPDC003376]